MAWSSELTASCWTGIGAFRPPCLPAAAPAAGLSCYRQVPRRIDGHPSRCTDSTGGNACMNRGVAGSQLEAELDEMIVRAEAAYARYRYDAFPSVKHFVRPGGSFWPLRTGSICLAGRRPWRVR